MTDDQFVAERAAALARLFVEHGALYRDLIGGEDPDDPDDAQRAAALAAANDLGALLQDLRRHEDAIVAHIRTGAPPVPLMIVDELYHSLMLLTADPADPADPNSGLELEVLEPWILDEREPMRRWLDSAGMDLETTHRLYNAPPS